MSTAPTTEAPELSKEELEVVRRFDYAPDAIALDEGHDFIQAWHLRMLDRFEFHASTWSKPRVLECWTYPQWGIVHGQCEFEARRILAAGTPSLEPPIAISVPARMWLQVVPK